MFSLTSQCLLSLEQNNGVSKEITDIQLLSFFRHIRVFTNKQPTDMGKEEPSGGVVRVSIRLRVFVMHPVIPRPLVDVVLRRHDNRLT